MKDKVTNNFGLKLVSLLFAILLWALVVNIDDPVDEKTFRSIPVKVLHEEIFTAKASTYSIVDGNETVNVTVRAKRSILKDIMSSNIVVTADIKNRVTNSINEATLPTEVTIKGFEEDYVEAYTTPKNLQIEIEPSTQKKFPIHVETIGTPRDGSIIGAVTANPEKIELGGGESQIDRIKKVVAKADVSGISSSGSVEAELILYDANGKAIDLALFEHNLGTLGLKVDVEILKTKNVPLEFDVSEIKPAAGYTLANIMYEPKTIIVAGAEKDMKDLDKIKIPGEALKTSALTSSKELKIDISKYLPKGIQLADSTSGIVIVTISIERFGTKVFSIPTNNIILENALAGLKPSVATVENIEIQIRGSKAALEKLIEAPKVFVDLQQYTTAGTITVPLQAELPAGCSLVEEIKVQIVLTEQ